MSKNLRRILYNFRINPDEQVSEGERNQWFFMIVNEPREIERIKQRIFSVFGNSSDYIEYAEGDVKNSGGVHYLAYSLKSDKGKLRPEEWRKIYDKHEQIKLDRNFVPKTADLGIWFSEYIERVLKD